MQVTGIRVVRGTAERHYGTPRSDVERVMAHYGVSRDEAERLLCTYPAKDLLPARGSVLETVVGAAPGESIELTYGDKLRVNTAFEYKGLGQKATLYGAIGTKGMFGFDEVVAGEADVNLPDSLTESTPVQASVDIPITADIDPKPDYDLYCKIKEFPEAGMPEIKDIITITGMPPTFELLEETIYPFAYVYNGPCEVSTFTFKTDPFTPESWISGRLADHVEDEVKKGGGRAMEMRIYVDRTPVFWTEWRIEVVGIPPKTTAGVSMSLGIVWWAIAILAALAIVLIIVITWSIKTIISAFTRKPISEEIKKTWSRETLISATNDFEVELEREPTPPEEFEGKSDQELRDYCDELAEEIAPPAEGAGLALALAAAGVLGIGALALAGMAMGKPEGKKKA